MDAADGSTAMTPPQDVVLVRLSTTAGHRRAEQQLVEVLTGLGIGVIEAAPRFGLVRRVLFMHPLQDLVEAAAVRKATNAALRGRACPVILPTSSSLLLQSARVLRAAAVRYDTLASEARTGARNWPVRLLERRALRHVRVMVPFSRTVRTVPARATVVSMPPAVAASASAGPRREQVICYAGNPQKKGLDIVVAAWARADLDQRYRLVVSGIDEAEGRAFLAARGQSVPPRVQWAGLMPAERYREMVAESSIFVSASRYEDFGFAQLEALADGALLVTTSGSGPNECLALAGDLQPDLVAAPDADSLALALCRAAATTEADRDAYRRCALALLTPYTSEAMGEVLRSHILPELGRSLP